jgi:multidrug resistance protein, MATE family
MTLQLQTSYRQILGMALPISLAMVVPQINFITNNVFLSRLGEKELASAGITGVYYLIFAVIGNGLNNGLQALIARRAGQNLPREIGRLFFHGVWIALAFAAVGILVTYAFAPGILRATLHNEAIATQVIDFLLIRIWGLPLLYLYVMRNALLVGTNQTRFLVWGTLAEALTNIVLDYGLIYGNLGMPELGFNGAAYASIIAEATGLVVIYVIIHFKGLHKQFAFFEGLSWDKTTSKLILTQSLPLVAQYAISILTWEYFYILIEHHGARALAVSNTMRNVFGLCGIFAWAFASTSSTMVSNIIGQGRTDEVIGLIKKITRLSVSVALVFCVVLNVWPEMVLRIFNTDPEFISYGIPVVRVVSVALVMMSFSTVLFNSIIGTGNSKINLGIEAVTIVLYSLYVYFVLEYWQMSISWGWASEWVYWLTIFTMAFFYLRSGRWKNKHI